jgi:rhamnosyltransferase
VVHSHSYPPLEQFRRTFDEWRALHEVHGWVQPLNPVNTLLRLQSEVRKDLRGLDGLPARELARSVRHHSVRAAGAVLGSRADRLPANVRAWCSLEERS